MPVEITLPLTKLEQAVADARENERRCALIVEDLKLQLKTAKATWEESVEELKNAVDEMIRDKRQPSLPFGESDADADEDTGAAGGPSDPNPPTSPAGEPVEESTTVTIISPPLSLPNGHENGVLALTSGQQPQQSWRNLDVAEHLDADQSVFETLAVFSVDTMGQLADRLLDGQTFNLPLVQVHDLWEVIEDVSADDPEPIKFYRGGKAGAGESEGDDEEKPAKSAGLFTPAPEPTPEPEPAKPAKKGRGGRKKKAVEAETEPKLVEPDAPEPEPASADAAANVSDDPFMDL